MNTSIIVIALVGFWIGLSKGGLAGPIGGAVILPLLSQMMTIPEAVGIILPLLLIGDLAAVRLYWGRWDWHYMRLLMPASVVGIAMGIGLLTALSDDLLRRLLGTLTLGVVAYKLASDSLAGLAYTPRTWHGYLAGWASGFGSALANIGGPPVTAYLLLNRLPPVRFVGTITLFFFALNVLKLPGYIAARIIDVDRLAGIAWMFPLIPLGVWTGRALVKRFNPLAFERLMLFLLAIAGLALLFSPPPR